MSGMKVHRLVYHPTSYVLGMCSRTISLSLPPNMTTRLPFPAKTMLCPMRPPGPLAPAVSSL